MDNVQVIVAPLSLTNFLALTFPNSVGFNNFVQGTKG
jgi:hypothetical protein